MSKEVEAVISKMEVALGMRSKAVQYLNKVDNAINDYINTMEMHDIESLVFVPENNKSLKCTIRCDNGVRKFTVHHNHDDLMPGIVSVKVKKQR